MKISILSHMKLTSDYFYKSVRQPTYTYLTIAILHVLARFTGSKRGLIRHGKAVFIGDRYFLDKVLKCLTLLKDIDYELYIKISEFKSLFAYVSECKNYHYIDSKRRVYSIPKGYYSYGYYGIILFIIYMYQKTLEPTIEALVTTTNWMITNGFPENLINDRLKLIREKVATATNPKVKDSEPSLNP